MIDGYSVQEAASVLGVPEGRVWELLARGVLSGTPEGDSMRVYLKADVGPIATASPRDEPARTIGNGGSHANGGEASAFRELLTEFRNLTERYGQALLALGEARGEVAGLRSRVDLLEARLDLRLPTTPAGPSVPWELPAVAPVAVESPAVAPVAVESPAVSPAPAEPPSTDLEPAPRPPAPLRRASRPRKSRSTRSAMEGFAQAMARAQDPTTADVGDTSTTADLSPQADGIQTAQLEDAVTEAEPEATAAELTVAAIAEPGPMVAEPVAAIAELGPMVAEPVVAEPEPLVAEPEPLVAEPGPMVAEPEPEPEPTVAAIAEPEPEPQPVVAESEPEPLVAEPEPLVAEPEPEPEPLVAEPEPLVAEPEVSLPDPEAAQPTYSAAVVEPDWFADGDFAWLDAADVEQTSPSLVPGVEVPPSEIEPMGEPMPGPISVAANEEAMQAQPESIVEPDRPSMPDLPQLPDLPPALDLPPTPEAQPQPSPEHALPPGLESEPPTEMVQSVEELHEPIPQSEPFGPPEASEADPAEAMQPTDFEASSEGPGEEEVMWLGAEHEVASEIETASTGWQAEARFAPTMTAPPPLARPEPPLLRMTETELARLARDEGWDEAEVAAIRAMIAPPPPRGTPLPGAAELDDAMAALRAVPIEGNEQPYSSREWAKPPSDARSPAYDDWAFEVEPVPPPNPRIEPLAPRRQGADPGWLRQRQGPAATAYRRLRRLFPG